MEQQTKQAIWIILSIGAVCIAAGLSGCNEQGPMGPQGEQGIQGIRGNTGDQGPQGQTGSTGAQGNTGPQGPQGATGAQGAPGENCTVEAVAASSAAPNGGSLISCPDGSQSLVLNGATGAQGATGATGSQGATGAQGSPGTLGSIVIAIQFCPGVTPTYPSAFPEVGFCIDGTLYAVYSANDGFLAEITPGTYSSDGINASCTFTVGANCEVSQ